MTRWTAARAVRPQGSHSLGPSNGIPNGFLPKYRFAHSRGNRQLATAERREGARPACDHDHLLLLPRPVQRVEHLPNPIVIREDQRIIEDDRHRLTTFTNHRAHREAHQHGDLLLCARREMRERFCSWTAAFESGNREAIAEL